MPTPAYADWLLQTDMSSAYTYERTVLQVLQSRAPGTWSLKMPSHAVHIETLLATYPDARIVWAHRDPFKSTASFLRLNYLSRAATGADIDVGLTVANVLRQLKEHVDRPLATRRRIGDDRFFDLHYADLMRDPIAVMRSLYDWAGDELTASTERLDARLARRSSAGPPWARAVLAGRVGREPRDLEPIFDEYLSVFDVELEGTRESAMRAAVTTGDHGFEVVDLPDPTPEPHQLVIRVASCGVCGSDIKAQPFAPAGMVMGHELGGEVVAVGSRADDCRVGTNVAVLPVISCGECQYCRAGLVSHCAGASYIGMGPAGGFAEFAVVPAHHSFPLPAELPAAYAALVEPFAVGLHGVHSAEISPGDDVLIVGAGGVGLTTLVWALQKGGVRVTVADPDPQRRDTARAIGATDVLASALRSRTRGLTTLSSNASDVPSSCRPASRRCDHGVASSSPAPAPSRPPSSPSPRCSRNSPSGTPSPIRPTNSGGHHRLRQRRRRPEPDGRADTSDLDQHQRCLRRCPRNASARTGFGDAMTATHRHERDEPELPVIPRPRASGLPAGAAAGIRRMAGRRRVCDR